jgi:hypothetical protein
MAGSRALRKLILGIEPSNAKGANVPATTVWRGLGVIKDEREIIFPEEDVGILGGTDRNYEARRWSELAMPAVEATFQQLPHILNAGVELVTGSADTGGSGYIWLWGSSTTSQNVTRTYSIEGGDDQQAEELSYGFVKSFNLSGSGQGALMMSADWVGQSVTNATFSATAEIPAVEEILVNNANLYIDATGGTIGTTTKSDTLFSIDLKWDTGLQEYWAVDGSKEFSLIKFTSDEIILDMTYEHNATAVAEKAFYRDQSTRLFRLKFEGSAWTTDGATYGDETLIIDLAGVYENWSVLEDQDGNDVVTATVRCRYSGNDALKAEIVIANLLAALPVA